MKLLSLFKNKYEYFAKYYTLNVYLRMIQRIRHHCAIQERFEIKTCAKCGKANDVMRKYCTRCGALLVASDEASKPEPVEVPEEEPVVRPSTFSDDEQLVRPSERASEYVEPDEVRIKTEERPKPPKSETMDYDRGREVVKDILEKVKAAEARSRGEEVAAPMASDVESGIEEISEEEDESEVFEEVEIEEEEEVEEEEEELELEEEEEEEEIEEEYYEEPEPPLSEEVVIEKPAPATPFSAVAKPSVSTAADEISKDEKIRTIDSDIKTYSIERGQLQSELDKLRVRLDEEVERYLVVAETKRARTESLERELKLAKKEYDDANKEYKNAENRRKKELSNADKRISDVDKRIKKAEDAKEKRIRDLEKERLKREEEAKKA